ncbi:MAG: hypothetical protein ACWA44_07205 [Thiotrichales bacterium]
MSASGEQHAAETKNAPGTHRQLAWLRGQAGRIFPIVEDLSAGLSKLLLLVVLSVAGILSWLDFVKSFSLAWIVAIGFLLLLPPFVLFRFWLALAALKSLPETVSEEVGEFAGQGVAALREKAGHKSSFNVIGQARRLWELKSLLGGAGELVRDGFNIGILINPLSLIFGVLALLFAGLVIIVAAVLLISLIF